MLLRDSKLLQDDYWTQSPDEKVLSWGGLVGRYAARAISHVDDSLGGGGTMGDLWATHFKEEGRHNYRDILEHN